MRTSFAPTFEENDMARPFDAATAAVQAAINTADFGNEGAPFAPLLVSVCPPRQFSWVWQADVSLYKWLPRDPNNPPYKFLPLGDVMANNGSDPRPLLFAMIDDGSPEPALAHPLDFNWLCDDGGSRNPNDINYWLPVAPPNYVAMGICFSYPKPDVNSYWCVHKRYCLGLERTQVWQPGGWHRDGRLFIPTAPSVDHQLVPEGHVLLVPQTVVSANVPAYGLNLQLCLLPIASIAPEEPVYVDGQQRTQLNAGVSNVVVVPYTTVVDPIDNQPSNSPFYYIAAEPYYAYSAGFPSPAGGSQTVTLIVGVSETDSTTFSETSSLTVSAEFGAEFGGVSSKLSASVTETLGLEVQRSLTKSTETQFETSINFPPAQMVYLWQEMAAIVPFRQDGSQLPGVSYRNSTTKMTYTPKQTVEGELAPA